MLNLFLLEKQLLKWLEPSGGENWIDLCCGTGDLSLYLAHLVSPLGSVLGVDFSSSQILIAKKRALLDPSFSISWLISDALNTGLTSSSFDGAVMAYGLRNLVDPEVGLREIHRLLKSGSKAGILDFNHAKEGSKTSLFQKFYLRKIVVPIASIIGMKDEYAYLEKSINQFPDGGLLESLALKVGFKKVNYKLLAGGQMGVLLLQK